MLQKIRFILIAMLFGFFLAGCGGGGGSGEGDAGNGGNGDGGSQVAELNFFEQELAGKWYRYHAYSDEDQYFVFNADRTACYFEYVNGSRKVNKNYPHWELRSLNGSNTVYTIVLKTESGGTLTLHEFHYALMEVRKGGYANLNMSRSNTSRDCQ